MMQGTSDRALIDDSLEKPTERSELSAQSSSFTFGGEVGAPTPPVPGGGTPLGVVLKFEGAPGPGLLKVLVAGNSCTGALFFVFIDESHEVVPDVVLELLEKAATTLADSVRP